MASRIFASLTLFVSVLFLGAAFAHAAQEPVGRVLGVKGTATVVHTGSGKAESLAVNASLFLMDKINTGGQSRLKVKMNDDTTVTLGQDAEMVISEFVYQPETSTRKATLKLIKGTVRSFISKMFAGIGSAFEVHTPTAATGARGTHNLVDVINDRRTLVVGISGITTVGNIDPSIPGEEALTDNHGSYVDFGLPPSPPFVVPDTLLQTLMEQTDMNYERNGGGGEGFAPPDDNRFEPLLPSPLPQPPITPTTPIPQSPQSGF